MEALCACSIIADLIACATTAGLTSALPATPEAYDSSAVTAKGPIFAARTRSKLTVVVDDRPDVESMFRQHFRRDLRSGRFVMEFALSAPAPLRSRLFLQFHFVPTSSGDFFHDSLMIVWEQDRQIIIICTCLLGARRPKWGIAHETCSCGVCCSL